MKRMEMWIVCGYSSHYGPTIAWFGFWYKSIFIVTLKKYIVTFKSLIRFFKGFESQTGLILCTGFVT